jgi:hypothetical protein
MPDHVDSEAYLFADDTKVYTEIKTQTDTTSLQTDWSDKWLLKFHPNKCKVMTVSNKRGTNREQKYHLYDSEGKEVKLHNSDGEKDIGVLVDDQLNYSQHIQQKINKENRIMDLIRRTFTYLNEHNFRYLFQALVRPHLEYTAAVWSPYKQHGIDSIENVQRRATKQIPSLKDMAYPDRPNRKLKMPTLKYRHLRGDMIETFKIITGIYDNEVTEGIFDLDPNTRTRRHSKKIKKKFCKINLRNFLSPTESLIYGILCHNQ